MQTNSLNSQTGLGYAGLANSRYSTDANLQLGLGNLALSQQKLSADTALGYAQLYGQMDMNNERTAAALAEAQMSRDYQYAALAQQGAYQQGQLGLAQQSQDWQQQYQIGQQDLGWAGLDQRAAYDAGMLGLQNRSQDWQEQYQQGLLDNKTTRPTIPGLTDSVAAAPPGYRWAGTYSAQGIPNYEPLPTPTIPGMMGQQNQFQDTTALLKLLADQNVQGSLGNAGGQPNPALQQWLLQQALQQMQQRNVPTANGPAVLYSPGMPTGAPTLGTSQVGGGAIQGNGYTLTPRP
jgi:hypothetical protein